MARISAVLVLTLFAAASAGRVLLKKTQFTVADKISVDGNTIAEGAAIEGKLGCNEYPKGSSTFEVCGCGSKVVAHLLTECQTYKQYDSTIGHCDCGNKACDSQTLKTGYSEPFEWKAKSFEILAC
eukprot:gnl/TRDRNA2_/TRDRNA2_176559_c0_seq28.p1 gnl/TRDRNA2_/TRDRNA2_176559_c0~~gnl/TRDRNA2_/TRDRNA2_176559_c0_seq28.p1  ORF type:complete len:126 (+),score=28.14 gnl/TRDRNA2_/TRDRNA2_176559_c0_seq28:56-433(+)